MPKHKVKIVTFNDDPVIRADDMVIGDIGLTCVTGNDPRHDEIIMRVSSDLWINLQQVHPETSWQANEIGKCKQLVRLLGPGHKIEIVVGGGDSEDD